MVTNVIDRFMKYEEILNSFVCLVPYITIATRQECLYKLAGFYKNDVDKVEKFALPHINECWKFNVGLLLMKNLTFSL